MCIQLKCYISESEKPVLIHRLLQSKYVFICLFLNNLFFKLITVAFLLFSDDLYIILSL